MKYWLFRAASIVLPAAPAWLVYPLARLLAALFFAGHPRMRHDVEANMRVVLGAGVSQAAVTAAARRVFSNAARYYADLFRVPALDPERFDREQIEESGYYEHVEPALRRGKGVLLVSAHLGTPEATVQILCARGQRALVLAEPLRPPRMSALVRRLRESQGQRFPEVGFDTMREAIRTLRSGGLVVVLSDRDIQGNGREIDFFGRPARLPTGAFELAWRTGATVIPGFAQRLSDTRWRLELQPPLELQATGDRAADVAANLRRFAGQLEAAIRRDPGQWVVLSRFWRD